MPIKFEPGLAEVTSPPERGGVATVDVGCRKECWKSHFQNKCHVEEVPLPDILQELSFSPSVQKKSDQVYLLVKGKIVKEGHANYESRKKRSPVRIEKRSESREDLDLTGSPLRCSFSLEDNFDDSFVDVISSGKKKAGASYIPLATKDARANVGSFTIASKTTPVCDLLPCWALCDGKDGTLFVGAHREEGTLTLHTVTFSGPYGPRDPVLRFETFLKKHMDAAPSGAKAQTVSEARAVFNLSGGEISTEQDDDSPALSALQAHLTWKSPKEFLESPSLDAVAFLQAQVVPGDDKMSTFPLWSELVCLRSFVAGLENRGVTWRQRKEEDTTLEEDLLTLLEAVKSDGPRGRSKRGEKKSTPNQSGVEAEDSKEEMEDVFSSSRQDVDFADQLWTVLHKVESYSELCSCLTQIWQRIKQEELRPFLYSNSSTKIEKIIHSIIRGTDTIPEMSDRLPLEILVEMGIEKLKRDYVHALMSSYLAGKDELAPFLEDASFFKSSIEKLHKLHFVLELIVTLQTYLSPNHECLRKIVLQALQTIRNTDDDLGSVSRQDFRFNIQIAHIKDHLSKISPSVWQCILRTKDCNSALETVAHLSVDPPTDRVKQEEPEEDSVKNSVPFFYTVKTSIKRNL